MKSYFTYAVELSIIACTGSHKEEQAYGYSKIR